MTPRDALVLLRRNDLIRNACDVARNPAFARADARTRDAHGKRIADHVGTPEDRARWPEVVRELVDMPAHELARRLRDEPVRQGSIPRPGKTPRVIGVPTFLRRCLSNLVNTVLTMTGDTLLPDNARAYRKGRPDAVRGAILDLAEAVATGRVRFFAKLDFSSYFTSMRRADIAAGLRHYGYEPEFVDIVLALVRCRVVRVCAGRTFDVKTHRGAQMGLPESSTLANIVPFELDDYLRKLGVRVFYDRYSDDVILAGTTRSDVVGAVRAVTRWARRHGIRIKGMSPGQRPTTVVRDIRKSHVDYLGAEVDCNGRVHMPKEKLREKLAELERRLDHLVVAGNVPGVSRYGDGMGALRYDLDDVAGLVEGFADYWMPLDPEGAEHAERVMDRKIALAPAWLDQTSPMTPSPEGDGQGVTWTVQLWHDQVVRGDGASDPTTDRPTNQKATYPTGKPTPPSAAKGKPMGKERVNESKGNEDENTTGWKEGSGPEPTEQQAVGSVTERKSEDDFYDVDENPEQGEESYRTPEDGDHHRENGSRSVKDHRFHTPLGEDSDLCEEELEAELHQILEEAESDEPAEGVPPCPGEDSARVAVENPASWHVEARRLTGRQPRAAVAICAIARGLAIGKPEVRVVRGRPEAALVRAVLRVLPARPGRLTVSMPETWLAKTLLQGHRRFRAPLLFGLVSELQRDARRDCSDVRIVGGVASPKIITVALEHAGDTPATTACSRGSSQHDGRPNLAGDRCRDAIEESAMKTQTRNHETSTRSQHEHRR